MSRVIVNGSYTVVGNKLLRDTNLTLKAKGLYAFMLSLPSDWEFSVKGLSIVTTTGTDAIRSGLAELIDNGYIKREQRRNEDGSFGEIDYVFDVSESGKDSPILDIMPNSIIKESKSSVSINPILENPISVNTTQINKDIINKDLTNKDFLEQPKKPRKIKRPYGKYQNVMLTDIQLEKLKAEHPDTYTYWIEECSSYCDSKDVSYSDYLRTIRNWINKSPKKEEYFKKLAEENKPKVKKAPSRYYEYFEEARNRKDTMSEEGWSKPLIYHAASEINWTNDLNAERNLFFARISFLEKMNIVL